MGQADVEEDGVDFNSVFGDELEAGHTLMHGQYTIDEFLNAGGFGITYRAKDSLNRTVVIKECFPGSFCRRTETSVQARSRAHQRELSSIVKLFVEEARSLARLSHPNIVGVHQVFEENNTAYMALDYVEGRDLLDIIEKPEDILEPEQAETILRKLLSAVGFIHAQGVLHRDISPDNILLQPDMEPILIDFGAAREEAGKQSRILSALRVVKDGYSPQEFYISGATQGPSSDLYALAATFYHLITGELPAISQNRLAAVAAGEKDPYIPVVDRMPGYSEAFLFGIDKALAVLPKDRITSAEQWLGLLDGTVKVSDLDESDAGGKSNKKTTKSAASAKANSKKSKAMLLGGVALLVPLLGGVAVFQMGGNGTPADAERVAPAVTAAAEPASGDVAVDGSAAADANVATVADVTDVSNAPVEAEQPQTASDDAVTDAPVLADIPVVADGPVIDDAPVVADVLVLDDASVVDDAPVVTDAPVIAMANPVEVPDSRFVPQADTSPETSLPAAVADADNGNVAPADLPDDIQSSAPPIRPEVVTEDLNADAAPDVATTDEGPAPDSVAVIDSVPATEDVSLTEVPAATDSAAAVDSVSENAEPAPQVEVVTAAQEPQVADAPEETDAPEEAAPVEIATAPQDTPASPAETAAVTSENVDSAAVELESTPAATASAPDAPVASASAVQTDIESYDLPQVMSAWSVDLSGALADPEDTVFAINGLSLEGDARIDAVLNQVFKAPEGGSMTLDVLSGPSRGAASVQTLDVPVVQKTLFLNGTMFETRMIEEGSWNTIVTAAPSGRNFEVGDILVGDLGQGVRFDTRTSLPDLLVAAVANDRDKLTIAVRRAGFIVPIAVTIPR